MTTDDPKPTPFPPIQGRRPYPDDVPPEDRPGEGEQFFWPLSRSAFELMHERSREADRARMMMAGSREIGLDMALMERFGLTETANYALARECREACVAQERDKYGVSRSDAPSRS